MTQKSRTSRRYALSIALFGLGVALLIAEQNAGIAWTVIVGSFALAASPTDDAASDEARSYSEGGKAFRNIIRANRESSTMSTRLGCIVRSVGHRQHSTRS